MKKIVYVLTLIALAGITLNAATMDEGKGKKKKKSCCASSNSGCSTQQQAQPATK
jgi:hypothetical protein